MAKTQDQYNPQRAGNSVPVALQRDATRATAGIRVTSPQIDATTPIPERHTEYGEGRSPALRWQAVGGARSYAVLVEDPDAHSAEPFVHWLVWNIPPDLHELPEDIRATAKPQAPPGIRQGRNDRGTIGWFGPRPPAGDAPHHYHFQVFALDAMLDLDEGASRDELLRTIDGRVLAKGELVATSQAPTQQ
jgi:Raf kinase inhibitor-like YbhB/YbcL family protein